MTSRHGHGAGNKSHITACCTLVALFLPLKGKAEGKQCKESRSERGTTSAMHFLRASGLCLTRISTMHGHCGTSPSLPSIPTVLCYQPFPGMQKDCRLGLTVETKGIRLELEVTAAVLKGSLRLPSSPRRSVHETACKLQR